MLFSSLTHTLSITSTPILTHTISPLTHIPIYPHTPHTNTCPPPPSYTHTHTHTPQYLFFDFVLGFSLPFPVCLWEGIPAWGMAFLGFIPPLIATVTAVLYVLWQVTFTLPIDTYSHKLQLYDQVVLTVSSVTQSAFTPCRLPGVTKSTCTLCTWQQAPPCVDITFCSILKFSLSNWLEKCEPWIVLWLCVQCKSMDQEPFTHYLEMYIGRCYLMYTCTGSHYNYCINQVKWWAFPWNASSQLMICEFYILPQQFIPVLLQNQPQNRNSFTHANVCSIMQHIGTEKQYLFTLASIVHPSKQRFMLQS